MMVCREVPNSRAMALILAPAFSCSSAACRCSWFSAGGRPNINSINANLRLLGITGFEIICHDAEMKLYRYLSLATLSAASNRSERATLPLYITSFTDIPVNACINNNLFFTGFVRNVRSATNGGRRYKFAKAPTLTHIFLIKHHRLTAYN